MILADRLLLERVLSAEHERRLCRNCYLQICGCDELDALQPQDSAEVINADRAHDGRPGEPRHDLQQDAQFARLVRGAQ